MALKRIRLTEFKKQHLKGAPEGVSLLLPKSYPADIKVVDEAKRILEFTMSTASVDRDDDTISVNGWKLDNYRKNPVVLWAHDHSIPAIGQSIRQWVEGDKLKTLNQYPARDEHEFGNLIFRLHLGGYLRSVSVGFIPLKWMMNEARSSGWGVDFLEQELIEHSSCNVPANPEALQGASAAGIALDPLLAWYERALDLEGDIILVERADLEAGRAAVAEICGKGAVVTVPAAVKSVPAPVKEAPAASVEVKGETLVAAAAAAVDALAKNASLIQTEDGARLKRMHEILGEMIAGKQIARTAPAGDKVLDEADGIRLIERNGEILVDGDEAALKNLVAQLVAAAREQTDQQIRRARGALD